MENSQVWEVGFLPRDGWLLLLSGSSMFRKSHNLWHLYKDAVQTCLSKKVRIVLQRNKTQAMKCQALLTARELYTNHTVCFDVKLPYLLNTEKEKALTSTVLSSLACKEGALRISLPNFIRVCMQATSQFLVSAAPTKYWLYQEKLPLCFLSSTHVRKIVKIFTSQPS